jgi:hypothetical protein
MTRDELVKKVLNKMEAEMFSDTWGGYATGDSSLSRALFKAIELHKPDEPDFPDEWESCVECSGNGYVAMYPCQTIKVIEKEIG